MTNLPTIDKLVMYVSGGLLALAIPVMGTIVILTGSMSPLYVTSKGGHVLAPSMAPQGQEIVTSPIFDPILRGYLVLIALVIFMLYAVYRLVVPNPQA
ncbi:MAG: hypothetical protein ABEJ77_07680 [Halanaeroarchaeum sp.]